MRRFLKFSIVAKKGVKAMTFERVLRAYFNSGRVFVYESRGRISGRYYRHLSALRAATPQTYERLFKVRLTPVGRLWKVSDEGVVPPELAAVVDWINIIQRFRAE